MPAGFLPHVFGVFAVCYPCLCLCKRTVVGSLCPYTRKGIQGPVHRCHAFLPLHRALCRLRGRGLPCCHACHSLRVGEVVRTLQGGDVAQETNGVGVAEFFLGDLPFRDPAQYTADDVRHFPQ